jgi:hypothetical protein
MVRGEIKFTVDRFSSQSISPFSTGIQIGGASEMVEEVEKRPYWEERTGEKKGIIFKREGRKRMNLAGFRCGLCNYIEIYAVAK